jgi:hypothetical protein
MPRTLPQLLGNMGMAGGFRASDALYQNSLELTQHIRLVTVVVIDVSLFHICL